MENQAILQLMKFTPVDDLLEPIEENYGFTICDSFESADQVIGPKEQVQEMLDTFGTNPLIRALGLVSAFSEPISISIIQFAQTDNKGMHINGTYYSAQEVTKALAILEDILANLRTKTV